MDQRKLTENQSTLVDMAKTQSHIETMVSDMSTNTSGLDKRVNKLEDKLQSLQRQIDMLPGMIIDRMYSAQSGIDRPHQEPRQFNDFRTVTRLSPPRRRRYIPPVQPSNSAPGPGTTTNPTPPNQPQDINSSGPI